MLKLRLVITALALSALVAPAAYAASYSKVFTVTNTGNGPLTISGAGLSGNTSEYSLTGNTCTSVATGGSCALTVRFTPAGGGMRPPATLNYSSNGTNGPSHSIALSGAGQYPSSCKDVLTAAPGTPSGNYTIDPDGAGTVAPFSVYCDMTSSGGGWTMVVRQYEVSPVLWTGQASGNSFSLAQAQIPAHTQVGFGKDNTATFVDYVTFQYTTGNIAKTLVTGLKAGANYHIHRDVKGHHDYHNPEEPFTSHPYWDNTLTFDVTGGRGFTWAFDQPNPNAAARGYALAGTVETVSNSFAWTVWVR